jgi:hypothetical protein
MLTFDTILPVANEAWMLNQAEGNVDKIFRRTTSTQRKERLTPLERVVGGSRRRSRISAFEEASAWLCCVPDLRAIGVS